MEIDKIIDKHIKIFAIGLGKGATNSSLKNLALVTGGKFLTARNAIQLQRAYDDILVEQYSKIPWVDSDGDGIPDEFESKGMICSNGQTFKTDPNNPDSDGDGLLDGEEIVVTYGQKYIHGAGNNGSSISAVYFNYKSNPNSQDSDNDGINDKEDTAPLIEGLEGGITGQLTLISCHDGEGKIDDGHAFFVYTSYINDTLDFSTLSYGWSRIDTSENWSKDNLQEDIPTKSEYNLSVDESISIGKGAFDIDYLIDKYGFDILSMDEKNGFNYNMEVYKYLNFDSSYRYLPNAYISEDITKSELNTIIEYGSRSDVKTWDAINNCAKFASEAWNLISETKLNPYIDITNITDIDKFPGNLVATPKGLYLYIQELEEGKTNYPFPAQFK